MKQLTNTEIQILSLLLQHALHAVDNNPYNFSNTIFKRTQITNLISKLDKMDDAIRKSKVVLQQDSYESGNITHTLDSLENVDDFINKYKNNILHYSLKTIKGEIAFEKLNNWRTKRRNIGLHQTI